MWRLGVLLMLGLLAAAPARAQEFLFRHFSGESGIPVARALAYHPARGLLAGTNDGLLQFDGRHFEPLALPGYDEGSVTRLAFGAGGTAWALAQPARVFRLPPDGPPAEVPVPAALREALTQSSWWLRWRVDPEGRLWTNDRLGRLWRYDAQTARWAAWRPPTTGFLVDFAFEGRGVWLAEPGRVGYAAARTGQPRVVWLAEQPGVVFVAPLSPGRVWMGTRSGLFQLGRTGSLIEVLGPAEAAWWHSAPAADADGNLLATFEAGATLWMLWLGREGGVRLAASMTRDLNSGVPAQHLFDVEGGLWVAHTRGLSYLEQTYLLAYAVRGPDGTGEIVKDLRQDGEGGLWVTTWGGLYHFRDGRFRRVSPEARAAATRPALARDGAAYWAEHQQGPFRAAVQGAAERAPAVFVLYEDATQRLFSTDAGLFITRGSRTVRLSPTPTYERDVVRGGDGRLWLGTSGLDSVEGDSLVSACRACGPPSVRVLVARHGAEGSFETHADAAGRVWVARAGRPLLCLYPRPGGAWASRAYGPADGLLHYEASSLYPTDDGRLWVGTWRGLQGFQLTGEGAPRLDKLVELRARDGLEGENVEALLEDDAGFLWVGCASGKLHRLDFRRLPAVPSPEVYLSRLEVNGRRATPGAPLHLRSDASRLAVNLGMHSFRQPQRVRFEYRLPPRDTTWKALGAERSLAFPFLPPGRHLLEVRAVREGAPPGLPVQQALLVARPFYQQPWFLALLLLAVAAPAALWYRARLARRLAVEQLRLRIATDLHDDIGSGLTQVSLYSELIRRTSEAQAAQWAEQTGQMARALSDTLRDIVWAINPEQDTWEALELRMKDYATALLGPAGVDVVMQGTAAEPPPALSSDVRRNVLMIVKEALHNAARHAGCTRVEVRWTLTPHRLHLCVTDDGRGFDPAEARGGNGLMNFRRRAQEIGATLSVQAAPGTGTVLRLDVPL